MDSKWFMALAVTIIIGLIGTMFTLIVVKGQDELKAGQVLLKTDLTKEIDENQAGIKEMQDVYYETPVRLRAVEKDYEELKKRFEEHLKEEH